MSLPLTANVASRLREGDYRIFFEIPIVRIDALHELDPPEVADGFRLKYTAVLQDGSNGDAVPIVLPEDALRQAYCNDCNFDSCAIGNGTIVMVHFMLRIPSRRCALYAGLQGLLLTGTFDCVWMNSEILVYVAEALCPHASQQSELFKSFPTSNSMSSHPDGSSPPAT